MQRTIKAVVFIAGLAIVAAPSFSQSLPDLPATEVGSANIQNRNTADVIAADKIESGIVYLPIPDASPFSKPAGEQVDKITGSIDITSIVNYPEPDIGSAVANSRTGIIFSTGGNPSIGIGSRLQAPSNGWDRYRIESSPQGHKGGILSGGLMAAFRIEI